MSFDDLKTIFDENPISIEVLDEISERIKYAELMLKEKHIFLSESAKIGEGEWIGWASERKRILYLTGQIQSPLLECNIEIRVRCAPYIAELCRKTLVKCQEELAKIKENK